MSTRVSSKRYPVKRYSAKRRRQSSGGAGRTVLVALVLIVAAGVSVWAWSRGYYADRITAGVTVNGQSVAGQNPEELRQTLRKEYDDKIAKISVKITYEDKVWNLNGTDLGAEDNVDAVVNEIKVLARQGEFSDRRAAAAEVKKSGHPVNVQLKLDPDKIQAKLEEIAGEVNLTGKEPTVKFTPDPKGKNLKKKELSKSEVRSMFVVQDGAPGLTVDVDAMMDKIGTDLQADFTSEQELIVHEYVPKYTKDQLNNIVPISEFDTTVGGASEREHNISLALSKVNGTVLQPGDEFSFNDTTGQRNKKNGYLQAHVIGPDKTLVDDWGGGVCQASTTLYNAALMANLQITDRAHHSFPSTYVRFGFDAMVNYPTSDLKFKNNSDLPVYIKAFVVNRHAYVMFLGAPLPDGIAIERESVLVSEGKMPEPEIMVDETGDYSDFVKYAEDKYKVRDSYPDRVVEAYLNIKDKDGKVIEHRKLYTDKFKAIVGLTVVGKDPKPTPTPTLPASPTPPPSDETSQSPPPTNDTAD